MFGKKPVIIPSNGKNAHILNTNVKLVSSASFPNKAEPRPPIPKAKPKNNPAIMPTLPGTNSVAYTKIAENADEMIRPMITDSTPLQNKLAYGNSRVNGAAPRMEIQIMYFLPKRSPSLPPNKAPRATDAKNRKR